MKPSTAQCLIVATETVIRRASDVSEVTSRALAAEAGVSLSAIAYHFGSFDALVARTGERVYQRLNAERLDLLQQVTDRHRPAAPPVADVIAALVGPSIRWSLEPGSAYAVFDFVSRRSLLSPTPELFRPMVDDITHHRAFITVLRRCAPWLSETDIGWRLNAALGIRSQVNRHRRRAEVLTDFSLDLSDAATVIAAIVEIVTPMFGRPDVMPRLRAPLPPATLGQ